MKNSFIIVALIGIKSMLYCQTSATYSSSTPLNFTSTGNGTYDKTVIYHSKYRGFLLELAKTDDLNSSTPIDFKINTRGGSDPFLTILGQTGNIGIGTSTPSAKLQVQGGIGINTGVSGNLSFGSAIAIGDSDTGLKQISDGVLAIYTNNAERFRVSNNGNVGIGITSPTSKLHINGEEVIESGNNYKIKINGYSGISSSGSAHWLHLNRYSNDNVAIGFNSTANVFLTSENGGKVGVGTTSPKNKLSVNGTIWAKEVKVSLSDAADWVFDDGYKLKPLAEVEEYIQRNKHLPEIPSAEEFRREDLKVSEITNKFLQKIEELTLYAIQQQKEIILQNCKIIEQEKKLLKQEKKIDAQNKKEAALENRLQVLEKIILNSKE